MAKIYAQKLAVVWETTASLASSGSLGSGSVPSDGYAKLLGAAISTGSGITATSAFEVRQSVDRGQNWDITTVCGLSACTGTTYSLDVYGNAVDIVYRGDTTASTTALRTQWSLRPI